jgi:biopolymer transport protein ExbB
MFDQARDIFVAGGWVMWPLAVLSVVSVALSLVRALFWWGTKRSARGRAARGAEGGRGGWGRGGWVRRMGGLLAADRVDEARAVAREDGTVYGQFVLAMLAETDASAERAESEAGKKSQRVAGAGGAGAVEEVRPAIERWSVTMSTIITAAPMLGILGTVLGIIKSFQLLGAADNAITDPTQVAGGIAEALLTTAFGLIVALITLFPYNLFRAAADRCFGRLETLAESREQCRVQSDE